MFGKDVWDWGVGCEGGVGSGDVGICGGGPSPPRASPCVLAPLVRVPLTLERRGTGHRSARPPRAYPACLLRSHAPLSSGTKGAEGAASAPGHPPAVSLRSPASPLRWSEGGLGWSALLDSCLRRNDGWWAREGRGVGAGVMGGACWNNGGRVEMAEGGVLRFCVFGCLKWVAAVRGRSQPIRRCRVLEIWYC